MTALSIRLRSDEERETIATLKRATHQGTASGALMRAAAEWPRLVEELRAARRRIARLEAALDEVLHAAAEVERAKEGRALAEAAAFATRGETE